MIHYPPPAMTDVLVMLTTAPSPAAGEKLARGLVEARLAACVNVIPGVLSIYRWKDGVQADPEVQLVIKTRASLRERVGQWIAENHTYDTPEVLALAVDGGSEQYLAWLRSETGE